MELLRNSKDKRAKKLAKRKVGIDVAKIHGGLKLTILLRSLLPHIDFIVRSLLLAQLGTMRRAKIKIDELSNIISDQRRTAAHHE